MEALTLDASGRLGGEDLLPVFGFEEEARMFLWAHALEPGWGVRRTSAGELVSLLSGPYAGVKHVAVDPLSHLRTASGMTTVGREAVLDRLAGRRWRRSHRPQARAGGAGCRKEDAKNKARTNRRRPTERSHHAPHG